jgi:hypothetical protein
MGENLRHFEVSDPAGRTWQVDFVWVQNAISIRHSDTVDVKFAAASDGERAEKIVALPHPLLLELSRKAGRPITDPWCSRLAAQHLRHMIETGEDAEKTLVTARMEDLEAYAA